jgi:hypothetical protein
MDLIRSLEFDYYAIRAANPDWDKSLVEYLRSKGISEEEITEHYPDEEKEIQD